MIRIGVIQVVLLLVVGCGTTVPSSHADAGGDAGPSPILRVQAALATQCSITATQPDGSYLAKCTNGCAIKWSPQQPEPYVTCAKTSTAAWTPPCEKPKRKGDSSADGGTCWNPPTAWCPGLQNAVITFACSSDGTQCCEFADGCIPCGWNDCGQAKNAAASGCGGGPQAYGDAYWSTACKSNEPKQMKECAICGDVLVCPGDPE